MRSAKANSTVFWTIPNPKRSLTTKELDVQWLNSESVHAERNLTMQLRSPREAAQLPGARLTFRFARPGAAPFYTQAVTDSGGAAEIKIEVEETGLARRLFVGAGQLRRTHDYAQIRTAQGGPAAGLKYLSGAERAALLPNETSNQWGGAGVYQRCSSLYACCSYRKPWDEAGPGCSRVKPRYRIACPLGRDSSQRRRQTRSGAVRWGRTRAAEPRHIPRRVSCVWCS